MRVTRFFLLFLSLVLVGCGLFGGEPTATPAPPAATTASTPSENINEDSPEIVQNTDRDFGTLPSFSLNDAPTLADLIETYPDLGGLLQSQDLSDPATVRTLYDQMVNIYRNEGVEGLNVFLKGSGLAEQLGMDSSYIDYLMVYEDEGAESAEKLARDRNLINKDDQLRLLIILEDGATLSSVQPLLDENNVIVLSQTGPAVLVGIPLEQLAAAQSSDAVMAQLLSITQHESVSGIRVPPTGFTNQQSGFVGQGVASTGATAWHDAGFTGDGVRVAIVDGGFGGFLDLVGTDLPDANNLFIHPDNDADYLDQFTDPHGAATSEIVFDMAPDAQLYLVNPETLYDYFELMDWLIAQDIDIVSHSVGFPVEPIDGTGAIAQLIDDHRDDFVWINATGNYALSHLDMPFKDNDDDDMHDFPDGEELLPIAPLGPGYISLALQWEGAYNGGEDHDYDIFLLDEDGDVVASSRNPQSGNRRDLPHEVVSYYVSSPDLLYVAIENAGAATDKRMNLVGNGVDFKYSMPEGSLASPSDAAYAVAVGATYWQDDSLEDYSSQGPTWDNRIKPDISAPARVDSVTYGSPFAGTSASAPHVAGAAALLLSANPGMDSADLRAALIDGAFDLGASGLDSEFGAGRVDLGDPPTSAVAVVPQNTPLPTNTPRPQPTNTTAPRATNTPRPQPTNTPAPAATNIAQPTRTASPTDTPRPTTAPTQASAGGGNTGSPLYEADEIVINNEIGISIFLPSEFEREVSQSAGVTQLIAAPTDGNLVLIVVAGGLDDSPTALEDNLAAFEANVAQDGISVGSPVETTVSLSYAGISAEMSGSIDGIAVQGRVVVFGADGQVATVYILTEEDLWTVTGESLYEELIDFIFLFAPE